MLTTNSYDSKKETGYVGLRNQGATCYLNSLLQSLYFTNSFRRAVFQIPTEGEDLANSALALQRLFYQLHNAKDAVDTAELTRSFGWDAKHIFEQRDVQELCRKLMEALEEKMKGTEAEHSLEKLFVGKMRTYIDCINVNYTSSRVEDFWDIQLNVRGLKNLEESFKDYVAVETLEGENKYFAEGHGLQEARKGVIFESFPQVLHLHLKRFEYDFMRDEMMKVGSLGFLSLYSSNSRRLTTITSFLWSLMRLLTWLQRRTSQSPGNTLCTGRHLQWFSQ